MSDLKFFKISGILQYPHIREPNVHGKYPSGKYQTDLTVDKKTAEKLTKLGVLVKDKKDDKKLHVTIKSTFQPTVIDESGLKLASESIPLMGNGTEATVTVSLYDNRAAQGGKKCLGMSQIELNKLIVFEKKEAPLLTDVPDEFE